MPVELDLVNFCEEVEDTIEGSRIGDVEVVLLIILLLILTNLVLV